MTRDDLGGGRAPVVLDLPFRGSWLARNSPARRVPSHGTHLFGTTYAIDFVAVDGRGLPAPRTWRTALSVETPELFHGFDQPVLAPAAGRVVIAHDGEVDHVARRSQLALVAYAVGQRGRVRGGPPRGRRQPCRGRPRAGRTLRPRCAPSAGLGGGRPRRGVAAGDVLGACGNSGNSTQPHIHVQVTDSVDWSWARGLPMLFRRAEGGEAWMPRESEIVIGP